MQVQADKAATTVAVQRLRMSGLADMILHDGKRKGNDFEIPIRKLSRLRFDRFHQNAGPIDRPQYYNFVSDDIRKIIALIDDKTDGVVSISSKYLRIEGVGVEKFAAGWGRAQMLIRKD